MSNRDKRLHPSCHKLSKNVAPCGATFLLLWGYFIRCYNLIMAHKLPDVRIQYGWLLANITSEVLNDKWGDGSPVASYDEFVTIAKQYEEWWRPYNDKVLNGICDILGLEFRQNIIDIYVSPWFSPISNPMVLGPAVESQDSLVNILAHELAHRLLTDNTLFDYDFDFISQWQEMFGDKVSRVTLIHIPVHAVMQKLYLDILERPDLLKLDIKRNKEYPDYDAAWDYVNKHGYEEIIKELTA